MNQDNIQVAIEDVLNLKDRFDRITGYVTGLGDLALSVLRAELARLEPVVRTAQDDWNSSPDNPANY